MCIVKSTQYQHCTYIRYTVRVHIDSVLLISHLIGTQAPFSPLFFFINCPASHHDYTDFTTQTNPINANLLQFQVVEIINHVMLVMSFKVKYYSIYVYL